ncbi:flagellar basal-body rod modification protein FlgD [Rosenbergiella nectarea]|uniref:Basal-body rod modification protein FlgD n=1 Tax=Rosenbergiella nectarea TaxID=988801 RepID=A0A1H9LTJ2_9GAMM|nr:flagellar hook assembly protein FlgD [Rosenbergiella nectarea]SER14589.1 flagellar basal-body rod modification protein FlgD [Rosenbergiella nectarea]
MLSDISSTNRLSASATTTASGNSSTDLQNQFLTLLIAQLKNQDPTNPMDNSQLTTQLAQINTLAGIENLNTTLSSISGQINTNQSVQNTLLIGHGVMVPGDAILVGEEATTPFGFETDAAASAVTATIKDSDGNVIAQLDLGPMGAGTHTFQWDGTLDDDSVAPAGKYTVTIDASNDTGALKTTPLTYAIVYGVSPTATGAVLNLGTYGTATLDQIKQIL